MKNVKIIVYYFYFGNILKVQEERGVTMVLYETEKGMRIDRFLASDPIAPFENRKIEKTEKEKEELRKRMHNLMYDVKELPD